MSTVAGHAPDTRFRRWATQPRWRTPSSTARSWAGPDRAGHLAHQGPESGQVVGHQPGHVCRTPTVRRALVPVAADSQSADRSGSLQLPPLFLKAGPAGGLRPPSGPAATRRPPGRRPHPPSEMSRSRHEDAAWATLAGWTRCRRDPMHCYDNKSTRHVRYSVGSVRRPGH
jgi:hypothetical protein